MNFDKNKVRESFTEYKKTLEQNLLNVGFLYSGDILSSKDSFYSEIKKSPLTSPSFMINSIVEVYNQSFKQMIDKSKEFIIPEESINGVGHNGNLFDKIFELGIKPVYIFTSEKGKRLFGSTMKNLTSALPYYFYNIDSYVGLNLDIFYSPLIIEDDDEIILYVSDAPIQSLVYSLQNMDYSIDSTIDGFTPMIPDRWKHTMIYNLYDCKFNSYKLSIRNVSRLRHDKINKILDGN